MLAGNAADFTPATVVWSFNMLDDGGLNTHDAYVLYLEQSISCAALEALLNSGSSPTGHQAEAYVHDTQAVGAGTFGVGASGPNDGILVVDGLADGGTVVELNANSGSITFSNSPAAASNLTGDFSGANGNESLTGSFDAPYCQLR